MSNGLSLYYQNVRGLKTKIEKLLVAVTASSYDAILLVETWLDDTISNLQLFGTEYEVFRRDRNSSNSTKAKGGGVLIAVHRRFPAGYVFPNFCPNLEQVWVKVLYGSVHLFLGAFYLPPDRKHDLQLLNSHTSSIENVCSQLKNNDLLYLCGDYNLSTVNWRPMFLDGPNLIPCIANGCQSLPNYVTHIIDNFDVHGLSQLNTVYNFQMKLLDLILANDTGQAAANVERAILPLIEEDRFHPALELHLSIPTLNSRSDSLDENSLNFNKIDYTTLARLLSEIDWSPLSSCSTLDDAVQFYERSVTSILHRVTPKSRPKPSPPWSTPHLLDLKRSRNSASRAYRARKVSTTRQRFFSSANAYRRENDRLYKQYVSRSESNLRRNPKSFWSFVNAKRKHNGLPISMFLGDRVVTTTPDICDLFATRFASVFSSETLTADQIHSALEDVPANVSHSSGFVVSDNDIVRAARKLKFSVSPGPDGIPTCILVKCADQLIEPLRHIFNLSLSSGLFPTQWKNSYMFPIFKKGERRDISNYRGITSLCSASKLLEVLVSDHLMSKFRCYISTDQHGFFPGRSVTTNLLNFTSFVTRHMEKRLQVDAVYTDLKAAFDCLNHSIIIAKLERLGLHGPILNWIRSYLSSRSLRVKIGAAVSAPLSITSGVPQGSNLGPLLFSIFFNDVSYTLEPQCRMFYADDLKIYSVIRQHSDTSTLQRKLDNFQDWCDRNRMKLSLDKCNIITFTFRKNPIVFNYCLGEHSLERVNQVCDLGVLLDTKLSYNDHMTSIISRANRQLGFIFRVCKSFSDPYCFRSLYFSLVRSILEFSSIVWSPAYSCWIDRIEAVQRRFVRYALAHLAWRDPINLPPYEERCKLINIETLSRRREKAGALFIAKVLHGDIDSPGILQNLNFHVPSRQLRSSLFFSLPFRRTNYGQNEPLRRLCQIFNKCSHLFDFNVSVACFKSRLDKFVFPVS